MNVVKADDTVQRRVVQVGHEDAQVSVITAGLQPGEQVVTDGASRLSDGAKVTVAAPAVAQDTQPPPRVRGRNRADATP